MTNSAGETESISRSIAAPLLRRCDWIIPIGAALFVLSLMSDVLFGQSGRVFAAPDTDMTLQFIPWRVYGFEQLRRGHFPFWTPHVFSGMPFFANTQTAMLYPFNFLYLIFSAVTATNWTLALHLFATVCIMALWCRRRGVGSVAALFGGLAFVCAGQVQLHLYAGHLVYTCALPWIPLVFLCLDEAMDRRAASAWGWALLGIFAVCMLMLCGYPQMPVYTSVVAAIYVLLQLRSASHRGRILAIATIMLLGGAALAAVQLLPTFQFSGESSRSGGLSMAMAGSFSLAPENLLTLLAPAPLGDAVQVTYFGQWYFWEQSLWIGLGVLILAMLGAVAAEKSRRRFALPVAIICIILALGEHTPLFMLIYRMPVLNRFRVPARFGLYAAMMLSMLAALGADWLLSRSRSIGERALPEMNAMGRARWIAVAAGAIGLGMLFAGTEFVGSAGAQHMARIIDGIGRFRSGPFKNTDRDLAIHAAVALSQQAFIGGAIALAITTLIPLSRRSRAAAGFAIAIAAAQVIAFAFHERATSLPVTKIPQSWVNLLHSEPPDARVLVASYRYHNTGDVFLFNNIWDYDPLLLRRYTQFMAITQGDDPATADYEMPIQSVSRWFSLLRCAAVLIDDPGFQPVTLLHGAMPHGVLYGQYLLRSRGSAVWQAMQNPQFDVAHQVILESPPDPMPLRSRNPGNVQVIERDAETLEINADLNSPQILLITDVYAEGWRATAMEPGPQAHYDVLPADNTLRAIPLAAGHHHILMRYIPPGWRAGCWISATALIAYLGAIGLWLRCRRDSKTPAVTQSAAIG